MRNWHVASCVAVHFDMVVLWLTSFAFLSSQAVKALHEKEIEGRALWVGRAQKKSERMAELRSRFDKSRHGRQAPRDVNLYVKNLDDEIDDERLRKEFSSFGSITSAKVRSSFFFCLKMFSLLFCNVKLVRSLFFHGLFTNLSGALGSLCTSVARTYFLVGVTQ